MKISGSGFRGAVCPDAVLPVKICGKACLAGRIDDAEIYHPGASVDPSVGGEIQKQRPAVIVSNDAANRFLNCVQVVPLTGSTDRLYPSEAYVTLKGKRSKAMTDQLTMVCKQRLINKAGSLSLMDMQNVARAITTQLDL
jgi:mRNA interferase MazF